MKTNAKRKRKKGKLILFILLLTIAAVFFVIMNEKGFFNIDSIYIQGNTNITDSEILEACAIKKGDNIFSFSAKKASLKIQALINVKSAEVKKVFPSGVRITVIERIPFACINYNDKYFETDDEGLIINVFENAAQTSGVVVYNSGYVYDPSYMFIDYSSSSALKTVHEVISYINSCGLNSSVSEIYVSDKGCYYIYTNNSNVIKFYSLSAFSANREFVAEFIRYEKRNIMVEVVEGVDPIYRQIEIN